MGNCKELIWLEHGPGRVESGKKFLLERKAVAKSQKAICAQPSSLDCNQEGQLLQLVPEANFPFNSWYNEANSTVRTMSRTEVRWHQAM